jgi:hypothetical protein
MASLLETTVRDVSHSPALGPVGRQCASHVRRRTMTVRERPASVSPSERLGMFNRRVTSGSTYRWRQGIVFCSSTADAWDKRRWSDSRPAASPLGPDNHPPRVRRPAPLRSAASPSSIGRTSGLATGVSNVVGPGGGRHAPRPYPSTLRPHEPAPGSSPVRIIEFAVARLRQRSAATGGRSSDCAPEDYRDCCTKCGAPCAGGGLGVITLARSRCIRSATARVWIGTSPRSATRRLYIGVSWNTLPAFCCLDPGLQKVLWDTCLQSCGTGECVRPRLGGKCGRRPGQRRGGQQ